jgi:hypothetical protein
MDIDEELIDIGEEEEEKQHEVIQIKQRYVVDFYPCRYISQKKKKQNKTKRRCLIF